MLTTRGFEPSPGVYWRRLLLIVANAVLLAALLPACDTTRAPSKHTPPPADRTEAAAQVEKRATVDAPAALHEAASTIDKATSAGRADVAELESTVPGVREAPATPRLYRSFDVIEDARKRVAAEADALAALQPIAADVRAGLAELVSYGKQERQRADTEAKARAAAEQEAAKQKARADDAFKRRLEGWAALAIVGAIGCGIVAVVMAWKLNFGGAIGMACVSGLLITAAVLLFVIADYWQWIVGGVLLTFAGFVGWLILSRLDRDKLRTTLKAIVPVIDKHDPAGTSIKAEIAKEAGKAAPVVKQTVTGVKLALAKEAA